MPITKTCKCGTETVTEQNKLDALKEVVEGCADCGQEVKFNATTAGKVRPGRGK